MPHPDKPAFNLKIWMVISLALLTALAALGHRTPAQAAESASLASGFAAGSIGPAQISASQAMTTTRHWQNYIQPGQINDLAVLGDEIWAATDEGVIRWSRADGSYIHYTDSNGLPGRTIARIQIDQTGRPWTATAFGHELSYFDGHRWIEASLETGLLAQAQGLSIDANVAAIDREGQHWTAGQQSGVPFVGNQTVTYTPADGLPDQPINLLAFDSMNRLWLGTEGGGVARFDGKRWLTYTADDGLASNWISAISFDSADHPWVGTKTGGLSYFDGQGWTNYTSADGLTSNIIEAIFIDDEGQVWVVTRDHSISKFILNERERVNGQPWLTYAPPDDSAQGWVTAATVDDAGDFWLGRADGRVSHFDGERWTTYTTTNPAEDVISAIAFDETGHTWLGTRGSGLNLFDGKRWTTYTTDDGLLDNEVRALALDQAGRLWIATPDGVSRFALNNAGEPDNNSWTSYTTAEGLISNDVLSLAVDQTGGVWFGTSEGASYFDGETWTSYTTDNGLIYNNIRAIAIDKTGGVWFGTAGVSHYDGKTWTGYTIEDGLIANAVRSVATDDAGRVWVGTDSGLSLFDGQTWTSYTKDNGLAGVAADTVAIDADGHVWVGATFGGVSEFDGQQWTTHLKNVGATVIAVDPANRKWFGTYGLGVRALSSDAESETPAHPLVEPTIVPVQQITLTTQAAPLAIPSAPNLPPITSPKQPLLAWSVAPDGAVFVVDALNTLFQLAPADLTPLAQSPPLFKTAADETVYLLAGSDRIMIGSRATTTTLVLDRADFSEVTRLEQAGPMALDPGRRLFMIPQQIVPRPPIYNWEVWAYNLADLTQAPQVIPTTCPAGPPVIAPLKRRLYLQKFTCDSSPPHRRDFYTALDLDSLTFIANTEIRDPGGMDSPSLAERAGLMFTVYRQANGQAYPLIFDLQGQALTAGEINDYYGAAPVIDSQGEWIYLIRTRGLEVRRVADFSVQSLMPFTTDPPAGSALSPDEETLYLFGHGWLEALSTAELQEMGVAPVSPLPVTWTQEQDNNGKAVPLYVFPSPTFAEDQFAIFELAWPTEFYLTLDGGQNWKFLPALSQAVRLFIFQSVPISLSPDFNRDRTMMVPDFRSTDGGETWQKWGSRIAFTSDRDGNREIYTMNDKGEDIQRLTNNAAAEENAAWSPASTRLAFQSDRSGNWDIFTLQADCPPPETECDLQQLTDDPGDEMLPAWSPDGRSIAFVSTRDGNPEIYVMEANGQNQRRLTFHDGGDWRPAWLPDSQHLIFTGDRSGNNDIYQLTVPPAGFAPLSHEPEIVPLITDPADDRDPAVDMQGMIYFLSDREGTMKTYRYGTSYLGGEPRLEPFARAGLTQAHPSAFSSDKAFVTMVDNGATNIYLAGPYGSDVPLTASTGFNGQPAGGPPWWLPDRAGSVEWLEEH